MDSPLNRTLDVAKALANPARIRILAALERGECCVCQLTAILDLAPSTVSAHLSELRRAGFLLDRKDGKIVFYRLSERPELKRWLKATFAGIRDDEKVAADRPSSTGSRRWTSRPSAGPARAGSSFPRSGCRQSRHHAARRADDLRPHREVGPGLDRLPGPCVPPGRVAGQRGPAGSAYLGCCRALSIAFFSSGLTTTPLPSAVVATAPAFSYCRAEK